MSNITAIEARITSAIGYYGSQVRLTSTFLPCHSLSHTTLKSPCAEQGTNQGEDLSCDGGPLANTAHDPRCECATCPSPFR